MQKTQVYERPIWMSALAICILLQGTMTAIVMAQADLSIQKSIGKQNARVVTFEIVINNFGPEDAVNVIVEENLPDGFARIIVGNNDCAFHVSSDPNVLVWEVGDLPFNVQEKCLVTLEDNSPLSFHVNSVSIYSLTVPDDISLNDTSAVPFSSSGSFSLDVPTLNWLGFLLFALLLASASMIRLGATRATNCKADADQ